MSPKNNAPRKPKLADYNLEAGVPVHKSNDWHVPGIVDRIPPWTAGEIQDALHSFGFNPQSFDPTMTEPCICVDVPGPVLDDPSKDCMLCGGKGERPLVLRRHMRWVKGDRALRVPTLREMMVSPYLAACVVALMADGKP